LDRIDRKRVDKMRLAPLARWHKPRSAIAQRWLWRQQCDMTRELNDSQTTEPLLGEQTLKASYLLLARG
jgi:hypothetical protein